MKLWFQYWTDFDEATWGWRASLRHPNASIQCIDPQREWSAKHPTVLRNTTLMAREQRFRCAVLRKHFLVARKRGNQHAVLRNILLVAQNGEINIPCQETPAWWHGMAQVRKNAGDLRRYKIIISWKSETYLFPMAQVTTKNLHLRHSVIRSLRDQA